VAEVRSQELKLVKWKANSFSQTPGDGCHKNAPLICFFSPYKGHNEANDKEPRSNLLENSKDIVFCQAKK